METTADAASQTGQVARRAAEVYEEFFVPALFREWAERVAAAAEIGPGERVLDVACGTGILARAAASRSGPTGTVVGLDLNPEMLAVAARVAGGIDFREGTAESLPFGDAEFDAVVSQFGIMFFHDRRAALAEMWRVLRPGGRLAVAVWDAIDRFEGYAELRDLLGRLYGAQAAETLRAPFALGDRDLMVSLFTDAGVPRVRVECEEGLCHFPSLRSWLFAEVRGWVLADRLDDDQFEALVAEAQKVLAPFVGADGAMALRAPALVARAKKA